jgi:acetyltransferase-like isoleucine patch superfamily enzyme
MARSRARDIEPDKLIRRKIFAAGTSSATKYHALVTGRPGLPALLRYELTTMLCGGLPGAFGLAIRRYVYPGLFRACGKGLVLGRGVTIRHADKISLGRNVVIDDFCVLDGRGSGDEGIVIGDEVIINRGSIVQSKSGPVRVGRGTSIGAGTHICSMGGIEIGQSVLITAGCIISGGKYRHSDTGKPVMEQGAYTEGPVEIADGSFLGMRVLVRDAASIGKYCVINSGAVVTGKWPDNAVIAGPETRMVNSQDDAGNAEPGSTRAHPATPCHRR